MNNANVANMRSHLLEYTRKYSMVPPPQVLIEAMRARGQL
jgi:hypothetical protein